VQPVGVSSYAVDSSGTALKLQNNLQGNVRIDSVTIDGTTCTLSPSTPVLTVGKKTSVTCSNVASSASGDGYEYQIEISYTDLGTNAQYNQNAKALKLVGVVGNAVDAESLSPWCFQETANTSTVCGGLSSGTYDISAPSGCEGPALMIDGDYDTYERACESYDLLLYVNYTKPVGAQNTSLWQIKYGGLSGSLQNISIPSACWNQFGDRIAFYVYGLYGGNTWSTPVTWYCYDSGWTQIFNTTALIYEEAMWWNISS